MSKIDRSVTKEITRLLEEAERAYPCGEVLGDIVRNRDAASLLEERLADPDELDRQNEYHIRVVLKAHLLGARRLALMAQLGADWAAVPTVSLREMVAAKKQ